VNEQKDKVTEKGVGTTKTAAAAYLEAAAGADELRSSLDQLIDKINEANGVGQDAISANLAYQDALADVDEQIRQAAEGVDGYALTLDTSTQAGRDNLGMLNDLAERSQKAAEAQFALDGNTESYKATLERGRQELIDRATQLGYNADEAGRLADQIYRIPSQTEWNVLAETNEAQERVNMLSAAIAGIQDKTVHINVQMPDGTPVTDQQLANQFGIRGFARGGLIPGVPSAKDNIVAALATGEFVTRSRVVAQPRNRAWLEHMNAGGEMPPLKGYADGGMVRPSYFDQRPQYAPNWLAAGAAIGGASGTQTSVPVTQNIYPTPGMSEEQIGDVAAQKIAWRLRFS
jgi:hypothetical protein